MGMCFCDPTTALRIQDLRCRMWIPNTFRPLVQYLIMYISNLNNSQCYCLWWITFPHPTWSNSSGHGFSLEPQWFLKLDMYIIERRISSLKVKHWHMKRNALALNPKGWGRRYALPVRRFILRWNSSTVLHGFQWLSSHDQFII